MSLPLIATSSNVIMSSRLAKTTFSLQHFKNLLVIPLESYPNFRKILDLILKVIIKNYLFLKTGRRFSLKALIPSLASSVAKFSTKTFVSNGKASEISKFDP